VDLTLDLVNRPRRELTTLTESLDDFRYLWRPDNFVENNDRAEKHLTDILREAQKTVVDNLILSAAVR